MQAETITAVALGIGLSASCGFRVFIPMLVASVAARAGVLPLTESFAWLGSWTAIICFATAAVAEIMAYYIPFIDNLLDSLTTPMAIGAGTLLMTSVLPVDDGLLKWISGLIIGGGAAAGIQSGTVLLRLGSSKLTAGLGNHVVATGEHTAALGTSLLTLAMPLVVAALLLLFIVYLLMRFRKKIFGRRHTGR